MTIRNSITNDSCMHAMKGYFSLKATDIGVTDVNVDINTGNVSKHLEVADEDALYAVEYNNVVDFEQVMLSDYRGEAAA